MTPEDGRPDPGPGAVPGPRGDFPDAARRLAVTAARLHQQTTLAELLGDAVAEAVELVGAGAVSISSAPPPGWQLVAASAPALAAQGPPPTCLLGADPHAGPGTGGPVSYHRVDDLARDPRCAVWARAVGAQGWSRVWVAPVRDEEEGVLLGALAFCFPAGARPPDDGREELFAQHLGLAWSRLEEREQVGALIDVHHQVGKAQGVLMTRHNLDGEDSLRVLMRLAEQGDNTLQEAAAEVMTAGETTSGAASPASPSAGVLLPAAGTDDAWAGHPAATVGR